MCARAGWRWGHCAICAQRVKEFEKQLKAAAKLGADAAILVGPEEAAAGKRSPTGYARRRTANRIAGKCCKQSLGCAHERVNKKKKKKFKERRKREERLYWCHFQP